MSLLTIDARALRPLTHPDAMRLQGDELECTLRALRTLRPTDWSLSTDCSEWDVADMYRHILGSCEAGASMRENVHQLRAARSLRKAHGGPLEAALSAVQVADRQALDPFELVSRLARVAPKMVKGRSRTPSLVRHHAKLKVDGPVFETWPLGFLIDTIYLRDLWMHRVDLHRATGHELELTAEHDGTIVADVVAEWARRHGRPFKLELTGDAGGTFVQAPADADAELLTVDAVEFCRMLSGRATGTGLLETIVPF